MKRPDPETFPLAPEQIAFDNALAELNRAERKLAKAAANLPTIPADISGEFFIVEHGYSRWEQLTITIEIDEHDNPLPQYFHGSTRGWDAMSETGSGEHVQINGRPYATPDHIDWD